MFRLAIGASTLVLASAIGWSNGISNKLEQHISRRVHSGSALRESVEMISQNQRALLVEIQLNRRAIARLTKKVEDDLEYPDVSPLASVPKRTD
jgi:hypothetical protein